MTDKEIIKALECCGDEEELHWCTECPYYDKENDFCQEDLHRDALDLINRQHAEVERLTINMNAFGLGMKQEKERADTKRAEAIKEFAERLKINLEYDYCSYSQDLITLINDTVKEMVGDIE